MKHLFYPGHACDRTKFECWYYLYRIEQVYGHPVPWTVERLSRDTGLNLRSLQVLVGRWSFPSWRRILRRKVPDRVYGKRYAYILGYKGRKWLAACHTWIPDFMIQQWIGEMREHQRQLDERKRQAEQEAAWQRQQLEARRAFFKLHGYYPEDRPT